MTYRYVPSFGLRIIQFTLLLESIVRGLMYLTMPDQPGAPLTELEQSAPLATWGVIFITFSVVGLFGEALMSGTEEHLNSGVNPRAWPSFVAHAGLMILYVTLTLAASATIIDRGMGYYAVVPYDLLMLAYLHWLFARRRKSHVR